MLLLMLCGVHAHGAGGTEPPEVPAPDDDDAAALALPSVEATAAPAAPGASVLLEGAFTESAPRSGGSADAERLSLDINDDSRLAPQWRAVVGDRLDLDWAGAWNASQQVNTLKQAYLSWQPRSNIVWDQCPARRRLRLQPHGFFPCRCLAHGRFAGSKQLARRTTGHGHGAR
jgi:hypothetical protein